MRIEEQVLMAMGGGLPPLAGGHKVDNGRDNKRLPLRLKNCISADYFNKDFDTLKNIMCFFIRA